MKLAYIILAYKDVEQVSRLINRLRTEGCVFVVHVCKNTDNSYVKELKLLQQGFEDVHFCMREKGMHFYFGLVQGTLNALQYLYVNKIDYDYASLISGQDYPLTSNEQIKQFFIKHKGKEFISCWPLLPDKNSPFYENHPWGGNRQLYRVDRFHINFSGRVNSIPEIQTRRLIDHSLANTIKIFLFNSRRYYKEKRFKAELLLLLFSRILPEKRALPKEFELYGGSTWWTISRQFAEFVLDSNAKNRRMNKFFKYTLIPDEMYFQTYIMNSPFRDSVCQDNLREIIWNPEDKTHPIVFNLSNINLLINSSAIFARKFDIKTAPEILDQLDNYIDTIKSIE